MEKENLTPPQETGAQSNTEASRSFSSTEEASDFFETVKDRLLHVNSWHGLAGSLSAAFQLTDSNGLEVDRPAQVGDHFKIDIPAPGIQTGDGHDWVQIEAIEEKGEGAEEALLIRVRPASAPTNDNPDVAHFFAEDASSSFVVKREGATVTAAVYGRNEKPNTDAEKLVDKARNLAVAAGAITGAAKLQWKGLVEGLVGE